MSLNKLVEQFHCHHPHTLRPYQLIIKQIFNISILTHATNIVLPFSTPQIPPPSAASPVAPFIALSALRSAIPATAPHLCSLSPICENLHLLYVPPT